MRRDWLEAAGSRAAPAACLVLLSLLAAYLASPVPAPASSRYEIGEFTSSAIRAPYDFTVVDEEASRRRREEARRSVPDVVVVDSRVPQGIGRTIVEAFRLPREALEEAAKLRHLSPADVEGLTATRRRALERDRAQAADRVIAERLPAAIEHFERTLAATLTPAVRDLLVKENFGEHVSGAALALVDGAYDRPLLGGSPAPSPPASAVAEASAGGTRPGTGPAALSLRDAMTGAEVVALNGSSLSNVASARAEIEEGRNPVLSALPAGLRPFVVRIVTERLAPNAAFDYETTEARRGAAASAVIPVSLTFRRNQLIVGEGQEVTATAKLVLSHLDREAQPHRYAARFAGAAALVALLLFVGLRVARANWADTDARRAARDTLYISLSLALTWVAFWIWLLVVDATAAGPLELPRLPLILMFPFAALPMHTRSMIGFDVARIQLVVASVVVGLLSEFGLLVAAFAIVTGLLGAHLVGRCRRRGEILRAGLWTGLLSAAAAVPVALLGAGDWSGLQPEVLAAGMTSGVVSSLTVVAASRVTEWLFGYTTPVRLLEIVSYEQPLLRDLAVQAPGTFQHSIAVAALADSAAQAIGADALLVRAGALYHDVGKLAAPAFFGENQANPNPHDALTPRESARVILQHVADGLDLVGRHRLGEAVDDCVREHHGRSAVSFFLEAARKNGEEVDLEDFRYPGPSPRSRETAILMIADTVEATSRSMPGASEPELEAMVERSIDRLQKDGELNHASLTLGDLSAIAGSLVRGLAGLRHNRVSYPDRTVAAAEAPRS